MRTKTATQADRMLDAAAKLFGTHRFHEVRMEDIAAEASVGKGTLYRYFKDKNALYMALLRRATQQLLEKVQEIVEANRGLRRRLTAVVAGIIDFFDENPHLLDLIPRTEVLAGPNFPWSQARTELGRRLADIFEQARQEGEFIIADPELAVLWLLGGLRSVVRLGKRPRPADLPERLVAMLLEGAATTS